MANIKGRKILDSLEMLEVDGAPYLGAGTVAPVGSLATDTTGLGVYWKNGAADTAWILLPTDPVFDQFEDLNFNTLGAATNQFGVVAVVANGATVVLEGAATGNDYTGLVTLATGTTNSGTGRGTLDFFNSLNRIRLGGKRVIFEMRVRIPVLSAAAPAFTVLAGLQDGNATGLPVNGVLFQYTHSINTGRWRAITRSASTSTNVDSTITVVAGQWYELRAEINAAGTGVDFLIDGVQIGSTVTTTIPASTVGMRPLVQIEKASTSTTSRTAAVDYVYWKMIR